MLATNHVSVVFSLKDLGHFQIDFFYFRLHTLFASSLLCLPLLLSFSILFHFHGNSMFT